MAIEMSDLVARILTLSSQQATTIDTLTEAVKEQTATIRELTSQTIQLTSQEEIIDEFDEEEENPTPEEISYFQEIMTTHKQILGKNPNTGTLQSKKFLQDTFHKSAERKMWGLGVSLPVVLYLIWNIARELGAPKASAEYISKQIRMPEPIEIPPNWLRYM